MVRFYARFKNVKSEIAIFNTAQERDEWVKFRDPFSIDCGVTHKNATFRRIPQTFAQAYKCLGKKLLDEENYIVDEFNKHIRWAEQYNKKWLP